MTRDGERGGTDDETVATCPVCGSWFDDHGYQLVIYGLGSFDSIECAEKALRRQDHERRQRPVVAAATTLPGAAREEPVPRDSRT